MALVYNISYGTIQIEKHYGLIVGSTGKNVSFNDIEQLKRIVYPICDNQRFGLITHRINSYSVDPLAIEDLFKHPNLVAGAIVSNRTIARHHAQIEQLTVMDAEIQFFTDLEEAKSWIVNYILQY